jgi:(p)ppGpp synthase/HD superfamily hydrolase
MSSKIISFAVEAHHNSNHLYDGKPYCVHLAMVVQYAIFYSDCIPSDALDTVINACWLHDTIEDCRMTYNDILQVAGKEVAEIVYAVTNEKGRNRKERASAKYYEGIRNTLWAKYVKLCDRLANVKYSFDTNSKMLSVYRKEHAEFIRNLFPERRDEYHYKGMIDELDLMLKAQTNF